MNFVKEHSEDFASFPYGYLLAFLVVASVFTLSSRELVFDDVFYANQGPFGEFIRGRYFFWSSRAIIDSLTFFFDKHCPAAFIVPNIVILTNIPLSIWFLFKDCLKKELHWVVFMLCMTHTLATFLEAGAIATALNYSWPLSFLLFVFCVLKQLLANKAVNTYVFAAACFFTVFAANQEQFCVVLGVVSFVALARSKMRHGSCNRRIAAIFLLCAASLVFIVTAPGNAVRYYHEAARWFPDFLSLSFFYKVYLGFVTTFYRCFFHLTIPYLAFAGILGLALYKRLGLRPWSAGAACAFTPLAAPLLLSSVATLFGYTDSLIARPLGSTAYIVDAFNYTQVTPYLTLGMAVFLCLFILKLLHCLLGSNKVYFYLVAILALGTATRMLLGFSPSIFPSGIRTFILMDFSWIFAALILVRETPEISERSLHGLLFPCVAAQLITLMR